jgi:DNA-directed RNA polymerase specialized sigma24 family protein
MADQDPGPRARGDEAELFRAYNEELSRSVAQAVFATTPQVIEDACAFAWAKFMEHQPDRERNWRGWLFRVAQRQAWALDGEAYRHTPLRAGPAPTEPRNGVEPAAPGDPFDTWLDLDDAPSILAELPPRLRRIAFLRALGFAHREIGDVTGDSVTRVGQLVARANFGVADIRANRTQADAPRPPRAQNLRELEHDPPTWLVERIGGTPQSLRKRSQHAQQWRAWRRAALALDDYRRHAGDEAVREGFPRPPSDPEGRRLHARAVQAIDALEHERNPHLVLPAVSNLAFGRRAGGVGRAAGRRGGP